MFSLVRACQPRTHARTEQGFSDPQAQASSLRFSPPKVTTNATFPPFPLPPQPWIHLRGPGGQRTNSVPTLERGCGSDPFHTRRCGILSNPFFLGGGERTRPFQNEEGGFWNVALVLFPPQDRGREEGLLHLGAAHLPAAACGEGAREIPRPLLRPNESWGATSRLSRGLRLGGPSLGTSSARMGSG